MNIRKSNVDRRTVIEAYARYDYSKTHRSPPDFASWDWSRADAIDREMCCAGLKTGIPAGYLLWDEIELAMVDFLESAVHCKIFPGQPRKLSLVDPRALANWRPDRATFWYEPITRGETLGDGAPMLLRGANSAEASASWYVEDGSGRAVAFVANRHLFNPVEPLAIGYLGREPDFASSFMQEKFSELLRR